MTKHSRLVSKINNKKKKEKNNKKKQTLKVDFWDKQQKNNIHDNNKISSMGFDNIEINLVFRLNCNWLTLRLHKSIIFVQNAVKSVVLVFTGGSHIYFTLVKTSQPNRSWKIRLHISFGRCNMLIRKKKNCYWKVGQVKRSYQMAISESIKNYTKLKFFWYMVAHIDFSHTLTTENSFFQKKSMITHTWTIFKVLKLKV